VPGEKIALRIKDAVKMSGIGRTKLYSMIGSGKLRAVKVGGCRLILRTDLVAMLQNGAPL
jgi:excisionase family DNA binding protein